MQVRITHQISWARDRIEGGPNCDSETIRSQVLLGGNLNRLSCREGCVGDIGSMDYYCTDYSERNNWSTGKGSYEYDTRGVERFEAS